MRESQPAPISDRYEPADVGPTRATITVRFMLEKNKGKDKP